MKIISFKGGLGNQIFQYAFYNYLKKNSKCKVFGFYKKTWLKDHNGLEIEKVFNVKLPPSSIISDVLVLFVRFFRIFRKNTNLVSTDELLNLNSVYYDGYWQNKMFFLELENSIKFKTFDLNEENRTLLNEIENSESISVHVRRGDYLDPKVKNTYGDICTISYYMKAIKLAESKFKYPKIFFFSDDIDWVKNNLVFDNSYCITHNKGSESYLDMYLMSYCKVNIIANSSFSYWGAFLNLNNPIVIYPSKWYNSTYPIPDIFKNDWIGIE